MKPFDQARDGGSAVQELVRDKHAGGGAAQDRIPAKPYQEQGGRHGSDMGIVDKGGANGF